MTLRSIFLAAALVACAARAQDPGITQSGNVTSYAAEFFAPFNPITAEDMLDRIPGIQGLVDGGGAGGFGGGFGRNAQKDEKRGFGSSGDQILFNGRRLSSKNMTVASALQRIRAGQVTRIEVIRGDAVGMDVRSEGTLVNVVLTESLSTGVGTWEGLLSYFTDEVAGTGDIVKEGGKLSYAGDIGALSYVLAAEAVPRVDGRDRIGQVFVPASPTREIEPTAPPNQRLTERYHVPNDEYIGSASLTYTFGNGDVLNANGRYAEKHTTEQIAVTYFALGGPTETLISSASNRRALLEKTWEFGFDYQHAFKGGDTLKLLGIYTREPTTDRRDFFFRNATRDFGQTRAQQILPKGQEKILRGTWRTALTENQSLEAGVEVALNSLASRLARTDFVNGAAVPFPLFNPEGTIKESRLESFTTWSWRPTDGLSFDVAADTEYSKLKQRGRDVTLDRSFFFLKPRFDARWTVAPRNQLRLRAQRTFSQLDFAYFLPGFNDEPTRVDVIRAGNPNLVPDKRWLYEAVYEYRFAGDRGVVSLRGYRIDISDFIDQIPVDTSTVSATGNIGSAVDKAVELTAGLRLGFIGLSNATLDLSFQRRKTQATDPFDGRKRGFQRNQIGYWEADFRHDTEWRNFAYGFSVGNRDRHINPEPDSFGRFNAPRTESAFAEIMLINGIQLKLEGSRLLGRGGRSIRWIYGGRRGLTSIARVERSVVDFQRQFKMSLRGTF
jgi:hypothetical protein